MMAGQPTQLLPLGNIADGPLTLIDSGRPEGRLFESAFVDAGIGQSTSSESS
ncbi:MAG: hypothetical protein R3A46_21680 [Thermomicrobiales bacterium]